MKKHILLVDDEAEILEVLKQVLTLEGYEVTAANSADAARKVMQSAALDLMITDLQLEDSDGLQLVEELKKVKPETPVILLTGVFFDPNVIEKTLSKKISGYMSKTAPLKDLLGEVRRHIGA
ncbi:MAG TPA: response regulator [Opitutaceae bacterium]|nr:response regulator [Opitutaceae bacterium]